VAPPAGVAAAGRPATGGRREGRAGSRAARACPRTGAAATSGRRRGEGRVGAGRALPAESQEPDRAGGASATPRRTPEAHGAREAPDAPSPPQTPPSAAGALNLLARSEARPRSLSRSPGDGRVSRQQHSEQRTTACL